MQKRQARRQIFVSLALILNEKGEVLMGKRHDPKNRGMHDRWEFPGGKVDFGEHPADSAVREVREEVGISVQVERLLNIYSWFHPDRPHIQVVILAYVAHQTTSEAPRPNTREIKEVIWRSIDDAINMPIIENNKAILRDLKKTL